MNDPARLQRAIRDLHGLDAEHVESVPVREEFRGETIWDGDVEVFRVRGHPQATMAYAWSYLADDGQLKHVAVLGAGHIKSAREAVQAAIATSRGVKA